jgi:hypothetical protein
MPRIQLAPGFRDGLGSSTYLSLSNVPSIPLGWEVQGAHVPGIDFAPRTHAIITSSYCTPGSSWPAFRCSAIPLLHSACMTGTAWPHTNLQIWVSSRYLMAKDRNNASPPKHTWTSLELQPSAGGSLDENGTRPHSTIYQLVSSRCTGHTTLFTCQRTKHQKVKR